MWSFASDPELANHTFDISTGIMASRRSARSIDGIEERWKKAW